MQLLEFQRGSDELVSQMTRSLANLLIASEIAGVGHQWRDPIAEKNYREYQATAGQPKILSDVAEILRGSKFAVVRTKFPQTKLELLYPGFWQFTLWSSLSEITPAVATSVFNTVFADLPRVSFKNSKNPSVPEINHAHGLVYLKSKTLSSQYQQLLWRD
jgi:hypothetical protein